VFGGGGGQLGQHLGKSFFKCIFKDKIMNNSPQDALHQMDSNLHKSFLFKCRNEFHIMAWPPELGLDNKENYFCMWLHI
jgi:hypothetical protein